MRKDLIVKVCGMRDVNNVWDVTQIDADLLGFIFYDKSPRYVGWEYDPRQGTTSIFGPIGKIRTVGVFVNADLEAVILKVLNCELGYVQLHGSESPEYCQEVRTYPVKVIKAFGVGRDFDFSQLEPYLPHVDYFLFDTKAETHGGTGVQFDWSVLDAYKLDKPFFLSGGIGPNDVERIQNFRHPQLVGIDLNSKFETEPAYKDIEALKTFIGAVCPSGY